MCLNRVKYNFPEFLYSYIIFIHERVFQQEGNIPTKAQQSQFILLSSATTVSQHCAKLRPTSTRRLNNARIRMLYTATSAAVPRSALIKARSLALTRIDAPDRNPKQPERNVFGRIPRQRARAHESWMNIEKSRARSGFESRQLYRELGSRIRRFWENCTLGSRDGWSRGSVTYTRDRRSRRAEAFDLYEVHVSRRRARPIDNNFCRRASLPGEITTAMPSSRKNVQGRAKSEDFGLDVDVFWKTEFCR